MPTQETNEYFWKYPILEVELERFSFGYSVVGWLGKYLPNGSR